MCTLTTIKPTFCVFWARIVWGTFSWGMGFVDEAIFVWEKEIAFVVTLISFVRGLTFFVESVTFGEVSFFWESESVFCGTWTCKGNALLRREQALSGSG